MPLPEYKQLVDEAKREIKEIDAAELKRMQQSQENFTLIDVREPDEVAQGAIAGSKPLPRSVTPIRAGSFAPRPPGSWSTTALTPRRSKSRS